MLKAKDVIDPLYSIFLVWSFFILYFHFQFCLFSFLKNSSNNIIIKDTINLIVKITRTYPSDVLNNGRIKDNYNKIISFNNGVSNEYKKKTFFLFKEIMRHDTIRSGKYGFEIIKKLIVEGGELERLKSLMNVEEDLIIVAKEFVEIAKRKGFLAKFTRSFEEITINTIMTVWEDYWKEV